MTRSFKRVFLVLAASIAVASGFLALHHRAHAGPLKPEWVDADAQWLAHIDVTALMKSKLVSHVLENHEDFHIDLDGIHKMQRDIGIDPRTDIHDITVFGDGDPHDANLMVIVTASAAADNAVAKVKEHAPSYRELTTEGRTLHSFEQDDETMFFAIRSSGDNRIVFMARDLNRLITGMDVADGKAASLASAAKKPGTEAAPKPGPGAVFFAVVDNLSWIHPGEKDPASTMLRNSRGLSIELGENNGEDYADLSLLVGSADDATNAVDMLRGLMALGRMLSKQEPDLAQLGDLLNSVNLEAKGNRVRVQVKQNADRLIHLLHEAHDLHDGHDDDDDPHEHDHDHGHHERHHDH